MLQVKDRLVYCEFILSAYKENVDELNLTMLQGSLSTKTTEEYHHLGRYVLTHFFPIFSLRFKFFKPYNFCSSKYGQY